MQNIGLVLLILAMLLALIASRVPVVGAWQLLPLAVGIWIASEVFGGLARSFH